MRIDRRNRTPWALALLTLAVGTAAAQSTDLSGADPGLRAESVRERPIAELPIVGNPRTELTYRVTAGNARINRRLMGPLRREVQGVPAEPVDSLVWNGIGSIPIEGSLVMEVEPMTNTGFIRADWTDKHGRWSYKQVRFLHPDHHPSGARIGASVTIVDAILNEGISHNAYLHGDTGSGPAVLPTVFTYLATWGPAEVTLNGERFDNPFENPSPLWLGHLMVTEGVRRPDGSVRTLSDEIYHPSKAAEGAVEPGDIELHLTFHDDAFPSTGSLPSIYSFFYHLLFEQVRIEIVQSDLPERPSAPPLFPARR